MADHDIERDPLISKLSSTPSSSKSSESIDFIPSKPISSESTSLLAKDRDSQSPDYKATSVIKTTSQDEDLDSGSVSSETTPKKSKSAAAIISLLLIGVFISNADGTLVMATYATISSEFGAFGDAAWLTTSYTLASCAVQPIVGKLSDIYGRKRVLIASYAVFAVGSVLTGISRSMWQVIAGRVVSGLGAAGMVVIVSVLITDLVPLIQVASWRAYVNVVATLGRSIGGPLGGFLADTIGWRWSFVGQGPLILLAIFLVALKLPAHFSAEPPQPKGHPSKLRRIDFIGAFILATTIVSFLGALSLGGQNLPWGHPLVLGLAIGSVVVGSIFVLWEVNYAFEPIFPPSIVILRDVATPYAIMSLQTAAQVAMMFSVPLYFCVTANASNTAAGSHLFPAVLGNTVGGLLAGLTIQRTGKYKLLTILATISSSITYFLLIVRWKGRISVLESLEIIPGGFGTGMAASATFIALTSSVEHKDVAVTTGGMYLSSAIGMLAGIAVSSSVQLSSLRTLLGKTAIDARILEKVISNISLIPQLEGVRKVVIESYVKSLEYAHMVSLGCALLALLISFTIREHPLR